jgi:hypothetical protein
MIAELEHAATSLDDEFTPLTVCESCDGPGQKCQTCIGTGWLPRAPRPTRKKKSKSAARRRKK